MSQQQHQQLETMENTTPVTEEGTTSSRGSSRGRGRGTSSRNGRGRGGGYKPKPQPGPIATVPKPDAGSKPQPKKLSTIETAPKNDPMWLDFDAEGFEGLTPYAARNDFPDTYEGFMPLLEREYDLIHPVDKSFAKFISKSMK